MAKVEVKGTADKKFSNVKRVLEENFASRGEVGAAVAVHADGKPVVDLWGGYADSARRRAWEKDTLVCVFSITKPMAAICAHRLADQGKLDLDAPVARYWPEFAQAGKANIPVRHLMNHRAGLSGVKPALPTAALYDWARMVHALEAQTPWWTPGTMHGYHTLTFGWLVGEVVRRVSGKSVGTYWRDEVARPLKADFHIGLDAKEFNRVADMIPALPLKPGEPDPMAEILADPEGMKFKSFLNPPWDPAATANTREWRQAEIAAAGGHSNARALARIFGTLARGGEMDGVRVLSEKAIERATVEQSFGVDAVLGVVSRFGLGFALTSELYPMGKSPRAFGHAGLGGSIGFADPDARVGFGYTTNQIGGAIGMDPRCKALAEAVYSAL